MTLKVSWSSLRRVRSEVIERVVYENTVRNDNESVVQTGDFFVEMLVIFVFFYLYDLLA